MTSSSQAWKRPKSPSAGARSLISHLQPGQKIVPASFRRLAWKLLTKNIMINLIPIFESVNVGCDLFARGAPSARVSFTILRRCQSGIAQVIGHELARPASRHAICLPHQQDVEEGAIGVDVLNAIHHFPRWNAHPRREYGRESDFCLEPLRRLSVRNRRSPFGSMNQPSRQGLRGMLLQVFDSAWDRGHLTFLGSAVRCIGLRVFADIRTISDS